MGLLSPPIKERWTTFRSVVIRPWWWVMGIVWLIVSGIDTAKGELIPDRWAAAPRLVNILPGWPWWVWALIGLSLLWLLTLEGAHRVLRKGRTEAITLGYPSAPILAEPRLFFSNLMCVDFGYGGEGNFGGLPSSKWYGYVTSLAHGESAMTITRIALVIDNQEVPTAQWRPLEVGPGNYLCSFPAEIAKSINVGRHEARIEAFAKGKSWRSPDFQVDVPSH